MGPLLCCQLPLCNSCNHFSGRPGRGGFWPSVWNKFNSNSDVFVLGPVKYRNCLCLVDTALDHPAVSSSSAPFSPVTCRHMLKYFHSYTMKPYCSPTPSKDLLNRRACYTYLRYTLVGFDTRKQSIRGCWPVLIPVLLWQRSRCARRTLQAPTKPYFHVCLSRNITSTLQDRTRALY